MSMTREVPGSQLGIATAGTSLFLILITVTGGMQGDVGEGLQRLARGYSLAMVCAFAVVVLWTLSHNAGLKVIGERPSLLWLGYFPAAVALVAGGIWLVAEIFTGPGLLFHLGWIVAVIVLFGGILPLTRHLMNSG